MGDCKNNFDKHTKLLKSLYPNELNTQTCKTWVVNFQIVSKVNILKKSVNPDSIYIHSLKI